MTTVTRKRWFGAVLAIIILVCVLSSSALAAELLLLDMADGNWKGDATVVGGIDAGTPGDAGVYVVSADRDMNHPPTLEFPVELKDGLDAVQTATVEVGYRSNSMMTREASIYWDGELLGTINPYGGGEALRVARFEVDTAKFSFGKGPHKVRIEAKDTDNKWDFFQVDAIRISSRRESGMGGGASMQYEVLTLADANWEGDGNTWGGLDASAPLAADRAAADLVVKKGDDPAKVEMTVRLAKDFAGKAVRVTVGYRRNDRMARKGSVSLDGVKVADVTPFMARAELGPMIDSVLASSTLLLCAEDHALSAGKHLLSIEASETGDLDRASFQLDAILIEEVPPMPAYGRLNIGNSQMVFSGGGPTGPPKLALSKFCEAAEQLGAARPVQGGAVAAGATRIVLGAGDTVAKLKEKAANLKPFQARDAFLIEEARGEGGTSELRVGYLEQPGLVWAIAELQLRLRHDKDGVFIEMPPAKDGAAAEIFDYPATDTRGEYVNIGYNFPGITPHEWGEADWRQYIDYLVLARLNTVLFYIWVDGYSLYPGSEGAKSALNKNIHEGVRSMIRYAHERGLEVVYMICPSYSPRDVWMKHPEMHAEIEYVEHGFPAVCLSAPGAWDLMKEIWRSELEWFKEADAVQIWFYDPGGCWCDKNGCRKNQVDILARQVKEYGALFREMNPKGRVEYNMWPIWLWEERYGKYRETLSKKIKEQAGAEASRITAVGAAGTSYSLPLLEQGLGLDGSAFIFGSNPESGYFFLMPNLKFHADVMKDAVTKHGQTRLFGHRLEVRTRLPATWFMARMMWKPDESIPAVVGMWAAWKTADRGSAADLTEAILLLEKYTTEGADPQVAARIAFLTDRVFPALSKAGSDDLSYFPAMARALKVLADACKTDDNGALRALCDEFVAALKSSSILAPMAEQGRMRFTNMKANVCKGTNAGMF